VADGFTRGPVAAVAIRIRLHLQRLADIGSSRQYLGGCSKSEHCYNNALKSGTMHRSRSYMRSTAFTPT
jgi:hypothetical protein